MYVISHLKNIELLLRCFLFNWSESLSPPFNLLYWSNTRNALSCSTSRLKDTRQNKFIFSLTLTVFFLFHFSKTATISMWFIANSKPIHEKTMGPVLNHFTITYRGLSDLYLIVMLFSDRYLTSQVFLARLSSVSRLSFIGFSNIPY